MITREFIDGLVTKMFEGNHIPMPPAGPIRDSFISYLNPIHQESVEISSGFIPVQCYPFPEKAEENEIGCLGNMRIVIDGSVDAEYIVVTAALEVKFKIGE